MKMCRNIDKYTHTYAIILLSTRLETIKLMSDTK